MVVVLVAEPCATHSQENFLSLHGHSPLRPPPQQQQRAPRRPTRWQDGGVVSCETLSACSQHSAHILLIVANSSPDSVLEAFRRKSDGRSPAPLASPPGAAPLARSCGSSRTEQDCSRNDQRNNSRVKLTCLATV